MGDDRLMNGTGQSLMGAGALASQVYDWDFNVFEVHRLTGGRPLFHVTMTLLQDQGLLEGWLLDRVVMERYLGRVEEVYKANPYHNNTHAADVTQTAGVIMSSLDRHLASAANNNSSNGSSNSSPTGACSCCFGRSSGSSSPAAVGKAGGVDGSSSPHSSSANNLGAGSNANGSSGSSSGSSRGSSSGTGGLQGLSKLERFSIILASAVHDLGHPGVNNAYLVRTRAPTAVTYNDRSVNENMHASLAFTLALEHSELNIFANFSQEEYELVRKYILEMVLSTDMDVHFTLLKRFDDALAASPDVRSWTGVDQRSLLFQMLVHLADLANPSRPWPLALKWAEWVVTEFLGQGEKEAAAGIPISPPCDRSKVCMPAAQLFFIERFMAPTLQAFRSSAPSFFNMASAWLADTQAKWEVFKAAGVRFPLQGYPQLPAPPDGQSALRTRLPGSNGNGCSVCCGAGQPSAAAAAVAAAGPQQHCKPPGEQQQQQHPVLQQGPQQQAAQAAG